MGTHTTWGRPYSVACESSSPTMIPYFINQIHNLQHGIVWLLFKGGDNLMAVFSIIWHVRTTCMHVSPLTTLMTYSESGGGPLSDLQTRNKLHSRNSNMQKQFGNRCRLHCTLWAGLAAVGWLNQGLN